MGGPELQLYIASSAKAGEILLAVRKQIDSGDRLRVAPIQTFCEAHNRPEHTNRRPERPAQIAVPLVRLLRRPLPVVTVVADVHADVVEQRRVLEPFAFAGREPMDASRLIEDAQRQPGHLLRMLGPVTAALAQLDDAPAPDVRVSLDLSDPRGVAVDIVEDESLAQRQIAEREIFGAETPEDRVEKHRAGHIQIRAARVQPGHLQPLFDIGFDQAFADLAKRLRWNALIAEVAGLPGGVR